MIKKSSSGGESGQQQIQAAVAKAQAGFNDLLAALELQFSQWLGDAMEEFDGHVGQIEERLRRLEAAGTLERDESLRGLRRRLITLEDKVDRQKNKVERRKG